MITARDGRKVTAKEKAREIIMGGISNAMSRVDGGNMTDREANMVTDQLLKEANRIARHFGWTELSESAVRVV